MTRLGSILIILLVLISCTEKKYLSGEIVNISFSNDTIHFDTVFTTIGSTTRELRVVNPYNEYVNISRIHLGKGDNSTFRINVDGIPENDVSNIEIGPGDSIFIFVDVIIDPNLNDSPVSVSDSIIFTTDDNVQNVILQAWGQDIYLINGKEIQSTTWSKGKPYVVYNSMLVDTGNTLTVEEGTRILFHRNSTMYIAGNLIVNGTLDEPVLMRSDRLEEIYSDIPGQWNGLYFINGSQGNSLNYVIIENAVSGIHLGNLGSQDAPPDLEIHNSIVQHMTVSGISSLGARIIASNCVISHCGFYCLLLAAGGEYVFNHCTIANKWEYSARQTPATAIADYFVYNDTLYTGDLIIAEFNNTLISGSMNTELGINSFVEDRVLNCVFNSCLIDIDRESTSLLDEYPFNNCLFNDNPGFMSWLEYDFRPDTLSVLINNADELLSAAYPLDIRAFSRLEDEAPDIGAYERQAGENENEKSIK